MSTNQLIKVAIITVSDRCSKDALLDLSGAYLVSAFNQINNKYTVTGKSIVPDEIDEIKVC